MSGVRVLTDKLVPERAFYDVQLYANVAATAEVSRAGRSSKATQ